MFFKQIISLRWAVLENANTIYYFFEKKKNKKKKKILVPILNFSIRTQKNNKWNLVINSLS